MTSQRLHGTRATFFLRARAPTHSTPGVKPGVASPDRFAHCCIIFVRTFVAIVAGLGHGFGRVIALLNFFMSGI